MVDAAALSPPRAVGIDSRQRFDQRGFAMIDMTVPMMMDFIPR